MSREEFLRRRAEAAELGKKRRAELDQGSITVLVPSPRPKRAADEKTGR